MNLIKSNESKNLVGCCGLYCGLCTKYQSRSPSRCLGCRIGEQHSWCSIWNCCVKKHKLDHCSECGELDECAIFLRRKVRDWIPVADNLHRILADGLENWLSEQMERQTALEELLDQCNDGRSMSFYCRACARMPVELIHQALKQAEEIFAHHQAEAADMKAKAGIIKDVIKDLALQANINLTH
ncbi:MAG: DUF3795 domain-containing protein [Calditrichaeota bacterium]|nr:MAG: DUF3795 domain-containing protein [Calditrichota bacterium]